MDSYEFNKFAGAGLGALLVFLLLGFFSNLIYTGGEGGHGDHHVLAYAVEIEEAAEAEEEPEQMIDLAALAAAADPAAGERVFRGCKACHKVEDGANGVGPHLWGVVGRTIGSVDGYAYSESLGDNGGVWDLTSLDGFLAGPAAWAPGTKMSYAGLKKAEDRVNLIAWLNEADGSPIALAAAPAEGEGDAAPEGEAEPEAAPEPVEEPADTDDRGALEPETDTAVAPAVEGEDTEAAAAVGNTLEETAEAPAALDEAAAADGAGAAVPSAGAEPASDDTTQAPAADGETTQLAAGTQPMPADEEEAIETAAVDAETGADPHGGIAGNALLGTEYAALVGGADITDGEKVFRRCSACHRLEEGANGVGPSLWGVIGRDIASLDGYSYSDALQDKEGVWSVDKLMAFLQKPSAWAKGTKMAYAGLKNEEDRAAVIKFLDETDGSPDLQ